MLFLKLLFWLDQLLSLVFSFKAAPVSSNVASKPVFLFFISLFEKLGLMYKVAVESNFISKSAAILCPSVIDLVLDSAKVLVLPVGSKLILLVLLLEMF